LPLLWGSRSIAFSSKLYDGKLKGRWKSGSEEVDLKTEWENLDLEKGLQYLAEKWGLKFQGDISGNIEIGGDKKDWRKREGALTLQANGAKILASTILGGILTLPETTFEDLNLQLAIAKGRIVFDKAEVKASTLEGNVDGYISLGKKFSQSRLNLKVTMKPKGKLEAQVKDYLPLLKIQKDEKTGEYRFSIVGTFAHPRVIK
jgi:type II secretion system protein N